METFWKEYTITLPSKKEYVFDIRNKKTNCVFIQNHNIANVFAGTKPHSYEDEIPPSRTSVINRPFTIEYVYLYTERQTPVTIVETVTQNPIASFIQQEISKNISIDTTNTIIQNTPLEICQKDVLNPQVITRWIRPFYVRRTESIHDLGRFGAPTINIFLSSVPPTWYSPFLTRYRIYVFNKNTGYIRLANIRFPSTIRRGSTSLDISIYSDNVKLFFINDFFAHLSITNNAFRYISIIGSNATIYSKHRIVKPIR